MFWNTFAKLCVDAGKSPNTVAAECGVKSSGTVTGWKNGAMPRAAVLRRLADYFNVSPEELLGKSDMEDKYDVLMSRKMRGEPVDDELNKLRTEIVIANQLSADARMETQDKTDELTDSIQLPSHQAQRVARLYELADERDRQIIDLMLQKYEQQLPKVVQFVPKAPQEHRRARKDGFEDLDTFDQPSAAGLGNYLDVPIAQKEQYPLGIIPAGTSFGILISGDSMEPKIQNRATAFVQSAPAIDSGEIGIFVLNGQSYCKQLVVDREKKEVRLHSLNKKYEDIVIRESDELRTIGRVLGSYPPVGMGAKPFEP